MSHSEEPQVSYLRFRSKSQSSKTVYSSTPPKTITQSSETMEEEWSGPVTPSHYMPVVPKPFDELDEDPSPILSSAKPHPVQQQPTASSPKKSHPLE